LYGDVIFFTGCLGQLMMQCPLTLARDVDLEDVGVWQVAYVLGLYSFILRNGQYSLEDRDVMRAWVSVSLQEIVSDFDTAKGIDL
jgi:hypothetical protein